jgi:hypothetical protein
MWEDLCSVVEQVELNEDSDSLVWCYEKSGIYSTQSYYAMISFRGGYSSVFACYLEYCGAPKNSPFLLVTISQQVSNSG